MNRFTQFIHDNQIVIAAVIMFMAVIVYFLFNRYQPMKFREASIVHDGLTGNCYSPYGGEMVKPTYPATPATSH